MNKLLITIASLFASTFVVVHAHMTPQEWQNKRQPDIQRHAEQLATQIRNSKGSCTTSREERLEYIKDLSELIQIGAQPACELIMELFSFNSHKEVITDEVIFGYFFNCLQNDQFRYADGFFTTISPAKVLFALKLAERGYLFKQEQWEHVMAEREKALFMNQRNICDKLADIMSASLIAQAQQGS